MKLICRDCDSEFTDELDSRCPDRGSLNTEEAGNAN